MVIPWLWIVVGLLVVGIAAGMGVLSRRWAGAPEVEYRAREVGGRDFQGPRS